MVPKSPMLVPTMFMLPKAKVPPVVVGRGFAATPKPARMGKSLRSL